MAVLASQSCKRMSVEISLIDKDKMIMFELSTNISSRKCWQYQFHSTLKMFSLWFCANPMDAINTFLSASMTENVFLSNTPQRHNRTFMVKRKATAMKNGKWLMC
jgi:hypothetical protein